MERPQQLFSCRDGETLAPIWPERGSELCPGDQIYLALTRLWEKAELRSREHRVFSPIEAACIDVFTTFDTILNHGFTGYCTRPRVMRKAAAFCEILEL